MKSVCSSMATDAWAVSSASASSRGTIWPNTYGKCFGLVRKYLFGYTARTISFERSEEFNVWLLALKDKLGRARIIQRIRSAEHGNFGDCESVGEGVSEMRMHIGPGYRVYFSRRAEVVYLLLVGGDKSSQKRDIKRAIEMVRALDKE